MAPDGPEDELSAGNGPGEALGMVAAGGAPGPEAVDAGGAPPAVRLSRRRDVTGTPLADGGGRAG